MEEKQTKTKEVEKKDKRSSAPVMKKNFRKNPRKKNSIQRKKPEFDTKIIQIRRVVRVVKGGRRFSFSVALVAGNHQGKVGIGLGKAGDTALAIEKATADARKKMIILRLTKNKSIEYDVSAKYCASVVHLRPSPERGLVAGSSARTVLAMAGITDVVAKMMSRSKNQLNNARAVTKALSVFKI
jgi:small subunit ribosomal protein S5